MEVRRSIVPCAPSFYPVFGVFCRSCGEDGWNACLSVENEKKSGKDVELSRNLQHQILLKRRRNRRKDVKITPSRGKQSKRKWKILQLPLANAVRL
jgi:hypothetical protein